MSARRMSAADLSARVTFERRVPGLDRAGQELTTWEPVITLWAKVRAAAARDVDAAGQRIAAATIRVYVRRWPGIASGMRMHWDGRAWDIVGEPLLSDDRFWTYFDASSAVGNASGAAG